MAIPLVYVFTRNGHVAYVGRGDKNGWGRMRASHRAGKYDRKIKLYSATSARQNYLRECRLFHRHDPCDNKIHPRVPDGTYWRCPVNSCRWS